MFVDKGRGITLTGSSIINVNEKETKICNGLNLNFVKIDAATVLTVYNSLLVQRLNAAFVEISVVYCGIMQAPS